MPRSCPRSRVKPCTPRAAGLAAARLHLGCAETPATYLLPERLRELRPRHPELEVHLTVGHAARVLAVMDPEEVDLAVLADRERHPSLHGATFLHDRFVVIVATDDPWQERGHVAVCDLGTRRLLMRERGAGTRAFVDAALRAAGVHPAEILEMASLEALKRIAQAHGRGRCRRGRGATTHCRGARGRQGTPCACWSWMCRATAWPTACCAT